MKKLLLFVFVLQCGVQSIAQYKVRFIVTETGPVKRESIFISGTFNNWDSLANKKYLLSDYGSGRKSIELNLPAGTLRYVLPRFLPAPGSRALVQVIWGNCPMHAIWLHLIPGCTTATGYILSSP